jgi:hypothetical protein
MFSVETMRGEREVRSKGRCQNTHVTGKQERGYGGRRENTKEQGELGKEKEEKNILIFRGRTKGTEGDCSPLGRTISTNQATQSSQGLNHQPRSTHIEGAMATATYVTEDGLIWHQWEGRP